MERIPGSGVRSGNCRDNKQEISVEIFQIGEEIRRLMTENLLQEAPRPETGSSFTALLGLPENQAMELLNSPESYDSPAILTADIWRERGKDQKTLSYPFNCSPTFPSNAALVERAARFSIFAAAQNSPQTSSVPSNSSENSLKLKNETTDSESNPTILNKNQISLKRKERQKKGLAKKSKNMGDESSKLPYVHVRARRGHATDSHSLAERARREKINARMKLLQELVPGCSKISGTALVLDEIINHVQSLQREVEFLSMRLAAVNSRIDFNLDSLLAAESGSLTDGNFPGMVMPSMWPDVPVNGTRRQQHHNQHQQLWHVDVGRDNHNFISQPNSLFSYDSTN
ncbi:hypothetical protein HHK36_017725 [Tetracentron sinense]|uniref:BHLH domain-containing protein n=1 Tax=Tetracentron sinense TaxID=13715 RepID=A0A834Z0Z6_TETSI|nr:hypothetical protein HHK36_017725 [Tetracentron sinense]